MKRRIVFWGLSICGLIVACSGEDAEEADVKNDPYQKWDANTATVFEGTVPSKENAVLKLEKIPGTETHADGQVFNQYQAGFVATKSDDLFTTATQTATVTGAVEEDGTIFVTTLESNDFLEGLTGLSGLNIWSGEEIVLAEPIKINMEEMAVGETRTAAVSLEALGQQIPVTVTYGPVEDDVTLMSKMGPIIGCRKYEISGTFEMEGVPLSETLIKGAGYYHPTLGLVGFEAPDLGI